jgi:hypothetical protein
MAKSINLKKYIYIYNGIISAVLSQRCHLKEVLPMLRGLKDARALMSMYWYMPYMFFEAAIETGYLHFFSCYLSAIYKPDFVVNWFFLCLQ